MVRSLALCGRYDHPSAQDVGWWRSERRLTYPVITVVRSPHARTPERTAAPRSTPRPVLIAGATGTLGRAVARSCEERGLAVAALPRHALDITNESAIDAALSELRPWAVINCAGFVRVDEAEASTRACHVANAEGAATLARVSAERGAKFVTLSSDLVFDGRKTSPYVESDAPRPLSVYGRSKAAAEIMVLEAASNALVVRTAAFFSDHDEYNVVTLALRALAAGDPFEVANDLVVSPTYVPDLVDAMLDLAIDDECGIWHLANTGSVTWDALVREAAYAAHIDTGSLRAVPAASLRFAAPRPRYSALGSERAAVMPPLDDALARYAHHRPWERAAGSRAQAGVTTTSHPPVSPPTRPLPFSIG